MISPAWYRLRGAIFGLIFALGFFGGWAASALMHAEYVPAVVAIGSHLGARGVAWTTALALICMIAAYGLRVWGSSYLRSRIVWNADAVTDVLIDAGPFRYTRHPLYLGNALIALGLGSLAPLPGWIFIVAADLIFSYALIRWEEHAMQVRFGRIFESYRARVPALVPRLFPARASTQIRASFPEGLRAEIFTVCLFLGMIGLLVLPSYGLLTFIVLFILGTMLQRHVDRLASP